MKFFTSEKYPLSARVYDFSSVTGPNGTERTYFDSGRTAFFAGIGDVGGARIQVFSQDDLRLYMQIQDFRDKSGKLILPWEVQPQGVVLEVRRKQPRVNAYGYSEGYLYELLRV